MPNQIKTQYGHGNDDKYANYTKGIRLFSVIRKIGQPENTKRPAPIVMTLCSPLANVRFGTTKEPTHLPLVHFVQKTFLVTTQHKDRGHSFQQMPGL